MVGGGGGGCCKPHIACLGSGVEMPYWLALGGSFGINGHKNKLWHFEGPPFPACFSSIPGWHFLKALTESLLLTDL